MDAHGNDSEQVGAMKPDLMDRLRSEAINWSATCGDLFDEARTEILRLRAEREKMVRALERCVEVIEFAYMNAPEQPKELAEARSLLSQVSP